MREPTADIAKLVSALRDAIAEHGAPNNFPPGELHRMHGGPDPLMAGRIGNMWRDKVSAALEPDGLTVTYAARMFRVSASQ